MITRRSLGRAASSAVAAGIIGARPASADDGRATDIVVSCEPTLRPALEGVARLWRALTDAPVHIFVARSDLIVEQIARGARTDVLVTTGLAWMDAALHRALVLPESRSDAWRNRLVVAARAEMRPPVALTAGTDIANLFGAGRLAIADPALSAAGADTQAVLEKLGLWPSLAGRMQGVESTAAAAFVLAGKKADFGVIYATDVAADPRLAVVASIPDDAYPPVIHAVALTKSEAAAEAPRFREFLLGPEAQRHLRAGGLEVLG